MKTTSVVHEISMKISSVHRPKSEPGRTVVIGLSHRLHPHDVAKSITPASRTRVRARDGKIGRSLMVRVGSLRAGGRAGARVGIDGRGHRGHRGPLDVEHRHPAARG